MSVPVIVLSVLLLVLYVLGGLMSFAILNFVDGFRPTFVEKTQTLLWASIWPISMMIGAFEELCEFIKSAK